MIDWIELLWSGVTVANCENDGYLIVGQALRAGDDYYICPTVDSQCQGKSEHTALFGQWYKVRGETLKRCSDLRE